MKLSIVLPCYHPPDGWDKRIISVHQELEHILQDHIQLIIVDDGNGNALGKEQLDGLKGAIPDLIIISYTTNRGKGYALRQGVMVATGDIVIYTDIDFPYTTDSLLSVYNLLSNNECDVAVGVKNSTYYKQVPAVRRVISRNLRFLIRFFLRMQITDTQCGLKGFRKAVKPVFLDTTIDRYLFDLEFIHALFNRYQQYRVQPVEVQLNPGIVFRRMSYKLLFSEVINFMKIVFKRKH